MAAGGAGRGATARRARGAPGSARGVGWGRGARAYGPAGGARSARPRGRAGDLGPREAGRGPGGCTPLLAAAAESINSSSPRALTGPGAERELPWGPCLPFLPFPTPPQASRPRWRVQPRAAERQHPAPLRASHVASQNLGALFCQVAVMRGSLRGRERYSRRRGQRNALCKQSRAAQHVLQWFQRWEGACLFQVRPEFVTQDSSIC